MQQGNFERLKGALEKRFRESHPYCPPISDWKGNDIVLFQEDLLREVKGRVSEKWFYTHVRSGPQEKLPRIDVLNMLSRYVGFDNWDHFCADERTVMPDLPSVVHSSRVEKKLAWLWLLVMAMVLVGLVAFIWPDQKQVICFSDADGNQLIYPELLHVDLLMEGQTPRRLQVDNLACVALPSHTRQFSLIVDGPYYHPDTIFRHTQPDHFENISLRKDDYALMIHYFSTAKISDWQKRRAQLEEMIDDQARIFQVWEDGLMGMEMFNKQEFIDKMITPVSSLKNIQILDSEYQGDKIIGLRFMQNNISE